MADFTTGAEVDARIASALQTHTYTQEEIDAIKSAAFMGGAVLSTVFNTSLGPQIWRATQSGTYTNGLTVDLTQGVTDMVFDGTTWRNSVTPVDLSGYATTEEVDEIADRPGVKNIKPLPPEDVFYLGDSLGNYWFKSIPEKTEYVGQVTREEFDELKNEVLQDAEAIRPEVPEAFVLGDPVGNYWFRSTPEKTEYVGQLTEERVLELVGNTAKPGIFDADIVQVIAYGQSLSVSGSGSTSIDMYNTVGFGGNVLTNYDPDDTGARDGYYAPGITAMPSSGTESMKCAGRVIGQLIESVNKIAKADQDYLVLVNAPGEGGISYASCANKTGDYYRRLIESVRYAQDFAIVAGKSFAVTALCWIQGENSSDKNKSKAQVITDLTTLFNDLNTDIKAITGQKKDVQFFVYQVASYPLNSGSINMPLAHLELAETVPNIHFGTAMYQYPYADTLHLTSPGYRRMASTFGAQIHEGVVLGVKRSPIVPLSYNLQASTAGKYLLSVKFFVPVAPLVFDTTQYAAQANMGFSILNGSSVELIESVSLHRGDTVNFVCSANPTGFLLRYANGGAPSGGNLRDSQGDKVTTDYGGTVYRVDNWAPIFQKTITI